MSALTLSRTSASLLSRAARDISIIRDRANWRWQDADDYARRLAHRLGLHSGKLSAEARRIAALRAARAEARPATAPTADTRLLQQYHAAARRRRIETEIVEESHTVTARIIERGNRLALIGCGGWRYYSRAFGARHVSIRILCGLADPQDNRPRPWAVRIPATCRTIAEALAYIQPAPVRAAIAAGLPVQRQGDVYLIPTRRDNFRDLPAGHSWDAATRTLSHAIHGSLVLPQPMRAIPQHRLATNRGGSGRD